MTAAARARRRVRAPLLAVGAAAWLALVFTSADAGHGSVHPPGWTPASLAVQAVLMFAAMMVPLAAGPVRHVRDRSFARRRRRAVGLFMAGYALPWIVAAAVLLVAARSVVAAQSAAVTALALAGVAVCHASPWKQHCLNRCHAHPPLAAFGTRADLDVVRFGLSHARWCIGSCAALMLLPMLFSRGHLAVMAGVTLWLAGERLEKPTAPRWRLRGPVKIVRMALGQARMALDHAARKGFALPASARTAGS